jgi:hypothetical protein
MAAGSDSGVSPRRPKKDRAGRRLALAVSVSFLAHLALVLLGRPEYRDVADFAVEIEIAEAEPGPPRRGDPTAKEPEPEKKEAKEEPEESEETEEIERESAPAEEGTSLADITTAPPDAGAPDSGARAAGEALGDAGPGEGAGICLHDVFPFAPEEPSWLLWLSMESFRGTVYEDGLGSTLSAFGLYREMAGATGMDPETEVEGLLVAAGDVFDWDSYRVVATYDSGEESLRRRLEKNRGDAPGFDWRRTSQGWEAAVPGEYRWHLVGSGRVLAVTSEPEAPVGEGPFPGPPSLPDNPYARRSTSGQARGDAGAAGLDGGVPRDGGANGGARGVAEPSFPRWPGQVGCLTAPEDSGRREPGESLVDLARSRLSPDPEGHWPVALLTTSDPRAVGLGSGRQLPVGFRWASVKAYFSDPVRLEGEVQLDGSAGQVEALGRKWKSMARRAGGDPFLAMAGLGGVFDGLALRTVGQRIEFVLPLSESEVQAALLFIQIQGEALERRVRRARSARGANGPTS